MNTQDTSATYHSSNHAQAMSSPENLWKADANLRRRAEQPLLGRYRPATDINIMLVLCMIAAKKKRDCTEP